MYIPTYSPRHFEPVRVCEYTGNTTDRLKVQILAGIWHYGLRVGVINATTVLTITDTIGTYAIYVKYLEVNNTLEVNFTDPATLLGLMVNTDYGYLYHYLGKVTVAYNSGISLNEISHIEDVWEGGDIISPAPWLDGHSVESVASTHVTGRNLFAITNFDHGVPTGTAPAAITEPADPPWRIPYATGTVDTDLLWMSRNQFGTELWKWLDANHPYPKSHTWYVDVNYHADGPPTDHGTNTYLKWDGDKLVWSALPSFSTAHTDLTDISPGLYDHYDHIGHWVNPLIAAGRVGGKPNADYNINYGASIGNNSKEKTIDLDNRQLDNGDWSIPIHNTTEGHLTLLLNEVADRTGSPLVDTGTLRVTGGGLFKNSSYFTLNPTYYARILSTVGTGAPVISTVDGTTTANICSDGSNAAYFTTSSGIVSILPTYVHSGEMGVWSASKYIGTDTGFAIQHTSGLHFGTTITGWFVKGLYVGTGTVQEIDASTLQMTDKILVRR